MKGGWSTTVEDGSTIEVGWRRRVLIPEFSVLRSGEHVSSSPSHPSRVLAASTGTLIFIGLLPILTGILAVPGKDWIAAGVGVCYVAGGLLALKRSYAGVVLCAAPLALRMVLTLSRLLIEGLTWGLVAGGAMDLLFGVFLVRATMAIGDVRRLRGGKPV